MTAGRWRRVLGSTWDEVVYRVGWTLYFFVVWRRAITENASGGLDAGHVNIWGDWAIHFTMGSAMAFRDLFLHNSPLLLGSPFSYPIFANMLSAIFVRMGVPFFPAFVVPSFFFSLFFVLVLPAFFGRLLNARRLGLLASMIFLLNGGIGFLKYFQDVMGADHPWHAIFYPVTRYTSLPDYNIFWMNVIESMVIPQRAFQLGFPWMLAVLVAVMRERGSPLEPTPAGPGFWSRPAAAGVLGALFGFTPLVHTHAFLCGGLILASWCAVDGLRRRGATREWAVWWGGFAAGTFALALPVLAIFFRDAGGQSPMHWTPGWLVTKFRDWIYFWWINWGPALVAAAVGFAVHLRRSPGARWAAILFGLPFLFLFAGANLFQVHAWAWDNTKFFIWVAIAVCPFAAVGIGAVWSIDGRWRRLARPVAVLGAGAILLSGGLDVYRILIPSLNQNQIYTNEDLYLADWARRNTPTDSIWLTGDYHNNWIYNLAGRQPVAAYTGWLWTHGYDFKQILDDVAEMYTHPDRDDLYRKYHVGYIIVGKQEIGSLTIDQQKFDARFETAIRTENYVVYRYGVPPGSTPVADVRPEPPLPLGTSLRPGLVRRTYRGAYFFGKPLIKEGDSDINFQYGADEKKPFPSPASLEWQGYLRVPGQAEYHFTLESDDGSWLEIDGRPVIDNGGSHPLQAASAEITLGEGYHRLKLRYFDNGGSAALKFGWTTRGQQGAGSEGLFH